MENCISSSGAATAAGSAAAAAGVPRGARELVLACSEEGVIGVAGRLPWSFRADFRWFREVTLAAPRTRATLAAPRARATRGRALVMGRRTWESLPGPLPGRRNLVLSRTLQRAPGAEIVTPDALPPHYTCIGGAAVLAALPPPDVLHLTVVCDWSTDQPATRLPRDFLAPQTYRLAACRTVLDRDRTTGRFHHLTFATFVKT